MKTSLGARTLVYPTPVMVIGTYDEDGTPNAMTAAWGGVASSRPPCVSVAVRPQRATHANLLARRAFTVNFPTAAQAPEADYCGIVSGRDHDKLVELGLTAVGSELVDAPYIAEFPLVLECDVIGTHDLGVHTLFIGEIKDAKADESILDENGKVSIEALVPILYAVDQGAYYGIGELLGQGYSLGKRFAEKD